MSETTIGAIAEFFSADLRIWHHVACDLDAPIVTAKPLGVAAAGEITYANTTRAARALRDTWPSVLVAPDEFDTDLAVLGAHGVQLVVFSPHPRLDFIRAIDRFFGPPRPVGTSTSAVVSADAEVATDVFIGPGASVGRVRIGSGSVIHAGVHVYDDVTIGERVTVHCGTVLGSDGFGYERDESGAPVKFPHLGGVVIEDDVEIGANTVVDRGTLGDTVVRARAKVDNLCHIAHNVVVGEDTMIAAGAVIAGSTRLGNRVWIGPQAIVSDGLVVGDDAFVTMGSVVSRNVDAGGRVTGNFAVEHAQFIAHLRTMRDSS